MDIGKNTPVVITGGGSGLGEATARRLAALGAKVAIFDLNPEAGEAVAADIGGIYCQVDVSDPESLAAGFAKARAAHGQERILLCCAGIAPAQKTVAKGAPHDPSLFAKVINVNLNGSFFAASQAAAGMAAAEPLTKDGGRGVIIMTASIAGYEGQVGQAAYAASKGGIIGLALPMARDLTNVGVRVMAIAPGLFLTPMLLGLPQEVQDSLGAQVPFPARLADPQEYAQLAQQICENEMLNGSVIRLDGALRMSPR